MTITEYVAQQIQIANESVDADPSEGAVTLFGVTSTRRDWSPASNDLSGLVEALEHAIETDDTAWIADIGDALRDLAHEVEVINEIEAGPPAA